MSQSSQVEEKNVDCTPAAEAEAANLAYVSDSEAGFQRRRSGRGFTYIDPKGKVVRDPDLRQRFTTLAIPPAWQAVWICADSATRLFNEMGPAATPKEAERNVVQVIKNVAEKLGNTPAVCRQHYVHPAIVEIYLDGQLSQIYADTAKAIQKAPMELGEDEAGVHAILSRQGDSETS